MLKNQKMTVRLKPGYTRVKAWGILMVCVATLAALLFVAVFARTGLYANQQIVYLLAGSALLFFAIFLGYLPLALRAGRDRTLEVDAGGVRLYRGERLERDLTWARVTLVRFGLQDIIVYRLASSTVIAGRPGRMNAEVEIDLPRPRNRKGPEFHGWVDEIYSLIV